MSDVSIDDGDDSVVYSGSWQAVESQRPYRGTIHVTNSSNARATLTFSGISVMVFGIIRGGEAPRSSYSIDGGDQTVFTGIPSVITQYSVLCYTSPVLRNGQHTLTLTNLGNSTNSFFLDRFTVVSADAVSTNSSTSPAINTIIPTSSTIPTSISESRSSAASNSSSVRTNTLVTLRSSTSSSGVPPPTPSTIQNSNGNMDPNLGAMPSNNSRPTAAITGAVAAVVIVVLFSVLFMWLARRRRKQQESKFSSFESGSTAAPTEAVSLPILHTSEVTVTPHMNEQPPCYAMSEPPAYEVDIRPVVQVQSDSRPLGGRGPGLQMPRKS